MLCVPFGIPVYTSETLRNAFLLLKSRQTSPSGGPSPVRSLSRCLQSSRSAVGEGRRQPRLGGTGIPFPELTGKPADRPTGQDRETEHVVPA